MVIMNTCITAGRPTSVHVKLEGFNNTGCCIGCTCCLTTKVCLATGKLLAIRLRGVWVITDLK